MPIGTSILKYVLVCTYAQILRIYSKFFITMALATIRNHADNETDGRGCAVPSCSHS